MKFLDQAKYLCVLAMAGQGRIAAAKLMCRWEGLMAGMADAAAMLLFAGWRAKHPD